MKILYATHFFPPGHAGGTESYTLGLARTVAGLGHQPFVLCAEEWGQGRDSHPYHRESCHAGVPVRRLSWNWQLTPDPSTHLYDNPEVERHAATYLQELDPDVMHVTSCYSLGVGIIRAARRAGIPTALPLPAFWFISPRQTLMRGDGSLCHGPSSRLECARCLAAGSPIYRSLTRVFPPDVVGRGFAEVSRWPVVARRRGLRGFVGDVAKRRTTLRDMFDLVDIAFVPSLALKQIYVRNGYPANRLQLSAYGLDLAWVSDVTAHGPGDRLCIGYIGQIEPAKGVDVLVQAFLAKPGRQW